MKKWGWGGGGGKKAGGGGKKAGDKKAGVKKRGVKRRTPSECSDILSGNLGSNSVSPWFCYGVPTR